ncbi:DMT family transporter [Thalassovita taeanensis]|uniref:EamA-like transporter family protein n=1 Tax=Thalassovita taeanensis TaxID=657014 RepID=A0A1H9EE96_9RHOB|nr:DMT family transporter [Thalassovita taeanensis]SEQ23991.1 EamA-like transporter family protein [Thalassovita taeanensis]
MSADRALLLGILLLLGAGWGITWPLAKIAVSSGYQPFGLIFWQLVIAVLLLGGICLWRGRGLPWGRASLRIYLVVAIVGTVLPDMANYRAAVHLPSGILSVLASLGVLFSFPIALAMGNDRFSWVKLLGLCLGLVGVSLLVLPGTDLPQAAMLIFVPLAMIAPLSYALEGNLVARWDLGGLDSVQILFGASLLGVILVGPLVVLSGEWISPLPPYGAADVALLAASVIHALVYAGYVWLVGRAGSVYAAQIGYVVTGFGIFWAMVLLGEAYSTYFWAAMAVMLAGVFLVQPRRKEALVEAGGLSDTAST